MSTEPTRITISPVTVLALPDERGQERRITIHGRCFYALDGRSSRSFDAERDADRSTRLHIPHPDGTSSRAWVRFPHLGNWDARYLGYESLWALLINEPNEPALEGRGPIVRHAAPFVQLTVRRTIPTLGIEHAVTIASGTKGGALGLLGSWMHDRMTELWEGHLVADPLRVDPALFFSTLGAELGAGGRVEWSFEDTGRLGRPLRWLVAYRYAPAPGRLAGLVREYHADDEDETAAGVAEFTRALAGPGPHWR